MAESSIMPGKYWIKLYVEMLRDPKVARLPDNLWRFYVELILLAGETGEDGSLPSVENIAWSLRKEITKTSDELHQLAELGLVTTVTSGQASELPHSGYTVTNFAERQGPSPVAIRVRESRKRHQPTVTPDAVPAPVTTGSNDPVTKRYDTCNACNAPESESESESESEQNRARAGAPPAIRPNVFAIYEQNIGPLTPIIAEQLIDAEKRFTESWIKQAVTIAVSRGARNWKYISAILSRWETNGYDGDRSTAAGNGHKKAPSLADANRAAFAQAAKDLGLEPTQ